MTRGSRSKALYNNQPNKCKYCNASILANESTRLAETKVKQFCNRSCAAKLNNKLVGDRHPLKEYFCKKCQISIGFKVKNKRLCGQCKRGSVLDFTKGEVGRTTIQKHARSVTANRKQICINCNYTKVVETCHIKGVAEFTKETKLSIINHQDNLILLCPNCHWEFDHNLLDKKQLLKKV